MVYALCQDDVRRGDTNLATRMMVLREETWKPGESRVVMAGPWQPPQRGSRIVRDFPTKELVSIELLVTSKVGFERNSSVDEFLKSVVMLQGHTKTYQMIS